MVFRFDQVQGPACGYVLDGALVGRCMRVAFFESEAVRAMWMKCGKPKGVSELVDTVREVRRLYF